MFVLISHLFGTKVGMATPKALVDRSRALDRLPLVIQSADKLRAGVRIERHRRRSGFTIIELLLVTVVIAILAAIAIGRYRDMKLRAYVAAVTADLSELRNAEEAYWAENQVYTVDQSLLDWKPSSSVTVTISTGDPLAGFDVEALHSAAPGLLCKMYVGRSVNATPSGEVNCK